MHSLTKVKWNAAKAMLIKTRAEVMVLTEVWFEKTDVNLQIPDNPVVEGAVKGRGKKSITWIRKVPGEQHEKVRDGRHALLGLLHGRRGQHLVAGVHMQQRKDAAKYNEEMRQLLKVAQLYSGVPVFLPGDWNTFVPRHEATKALAKAVQLVVVAKGDEEPLQKDWALISQHFVDERHVTYMPGVADHPWVIAMAVTHTGGGAGMAQGHKPVVITRWTDGDRRKYGDIMEALSYGDVAVDTWLVLKREALVAIRGEKWEAIYPEGHWQDLQEQMLQRDGGESGQGVSDQAWRDMVSEPNILDAVVLSGETMRVLKLAKPFPLHQLTKLWDPQYLSPVRGDEVLSVVPRVAVARHQPAPKPLTEEEVRAYKPPAIGSHRPYDYGQLATARKLQITRAPCARILHKVSYPFTVWETIEMVQS